jgi:hypothetical protein
VCWLAWQEHETQEAYRLSLRLKLLAFHFINSYCALLYIAFWLQVPCAIDQEQESIPLEVRPMMA